MTILEKIKFEEDWLSEVNLTKENIKIAFAGIRATVLEQQPRDNNWKFYYDHGYAQAKRDLLCEDCISRKAIINTIFYNSDNNCDVVLCTDLMDRIKDLPSVTPQRPKGKWKPLNYKDEMWGYVYKCSNCGYIDYGNDYCPKCGARMESDKE